MTLKDLQKKLGTHAVLKIEKMLVEVEILDARQNFGRTEYLVKPLAGAGEQWVNVERLEWK